MATALETSTTVVVEEVPGGFEAGTEAPWHGGGNETRAGYWGRTKADALLAMICFQADGTKRLAEGLAQDCDRILATVRATADEIGSDELNPNAPTTVYQVTGQLGGQGEVGRLLTRSCRLESLLREHGIDPALVDEKTED